MSLKKAVFKRLLELLPEPAAIDWSTTYAAAWQLRRGYSQFVAHPSLDDTTLDDLLHIDDQKRKLVTNTQQFLSGLPTNHALLWGARGTGKSSLIHAILNRFAADGLRLIEVDKERLRDLPEIVDELAREPYRFIVFCDDLSFAAEDGSYRELKSTLEGSIFKTTANVVVYATSNRRHLVTEYMSDNQDARVGDHELHESEAVEEKISLSDRFGLWLSFYPFRQDDYLAVVMHWVAAFAARHDVQVDLDAEALRAEALRWALARGVRNGRTAQNFAKHWVGAQGLSRSNQS